MELTYINTSGEQIILRQRKPFFLSKIDGVGRTQQTINTFKAPEQDGAFYISSTLDMRNITLEGTILANTIDEAYNYRRQFLRVFTPKQHGVIVYRDRRISCVVEEAGFIISIGERNPNFFISLLCPSPFFETLEEIRDELALWIPLFHFVLEIPTEGIEFGLRQPSQIITVDNIGDVPCGCMIVFKALGTVTNPELLNLDTSEYVKINTTMNAGDELRIYTKFAGKRVVQITGGLETNVFSLLDIGSTFLQLAVGRNTLRYDASMNVDLLESSLYHRPMFLAV